MVTTKNNLLDDAFYEIANEALSDVQILIDEQFGTLSNSVLKSHIETILLRAISEIDTRFNSMKVSEIIEMKNAHCVESIKETIRSFLDCIVRNFE